jgi:predicted nucleic acid-binding protein
VPYVSEKTLKEVYQNAIVCCLADKVPNVRLKTVQILKTSSKLNGAAVEKQLEKLKDDKDNDVREMLKKLRG